MVTISQTVQKIVNDKIFILEPLSKGIISNVALAEHLKPQIEEDLGRKVKTHAIVMALRRYTEEIKKSHKEITFDYSSEIILKTDICDIALLRSPMLFTKLKRLYDIVDFEKGDILNIIHGRHEVVIVTNERYMKKSIDIFKGEKIFNVEKNLVSLTLTFSSDFLHTPGVIYNVVRALAWDNINIYEIVSTNTELTFILNKKDSSKAYRVLGQLVEKNTGEGI
jgi:aspartokinase